MTLLGKSFSVLILLLSLTFMVLALAVNASHRNWRDLVIGPQGLKNQIETISRTNEQLRDSRARIQASLDREQASRRTALAALQTQLDELEQQLRQSTSRVEQLQATNTELSQVDKARAEELQRLTQEASELREKIRTEQQDRDTLFSSTLKLTDEMNTLRGIVQTQEERNDELLSQVTRFKEVVDAKGIDIHQPLDGSPPDRNGKVLRINRPSGLVEVSIGRDEGLREGHMLEVTRGNRYVTKLQVSKTNSDRAVAKILDDYSEGVVQEGDRVDTTIE